MSAPKWVGVSVYTGATVTGKVVGSIAPDPATGKRRAVLVDGAGTRVVVWTDDLREAEQP